jgi:hypothetical protein
MDIKYRVAVEKDFDSLASFWNENADWDIIDRTQWENRFMHTPFGKATVLVATEENSDRILAQFVFIPSGIVVDGKQKMAFRPFAPILHKSLQTKFGIASFLTGLHPLHKLYRLGMGELISRGASLIYMIPDPRWARILKAVPLFMTHRFPLYTCQLIPDNQFLNGEQIEISPVRTFDGTIDALWNQSASVYPCSVIRDSRNLEYKVSHGDYRTYIVRKQDKVIGLFVFIHKPNDKQWLICDLISIDHGDNLASTLRAACVTIQEKMFSLVNDPAMKIAILATPLIEEKVKHLGFTKYDYDFTLAIHILNKQLITKDRVAPGCWYVSAND